MPRKKIAIIGPIPRDHIVTHQGELIQKWGCVTHPVIALSAMAGDKLEIIPVSHLRKVDMDNVREVFKGYKGINTKFISSKNDQGDIISLRFVDVNNRLERQTGFMDPIVPDDFKKLLDCKVFVFIPMLTHFHRCFRTNQEDPKLVSQIATDLNRSQNSEIRPEELL